MAVVNRTRREKKKKKEEDGSREEESANDIKDDIRIQDSSLHEEGQSLYEQLESVRRWNPEEEVKEEEREASGKKQKEEEEASLRLRSQSSFSCLRSDAEEKEQEEDLLLFDFPLHHFLPSNSSSLCCYEPPASSSSFLSLVHNQAEETREERNCPPTTTTTPSPLEKDVFLSHPCLTLSMVSSPCKKDNIYDIHHRNTSSSPPQTFPVDFSYSSCSSSSSPRRICISADLHLSSSRKKRFDKEKENKDKNQERKEGEEETTRKKTMHLESSRVSSFPRTFHATATISHRGQDRQIKDGEDLHPSHRDRLSNLFNQTCERNLSLSSSSFFFLSSQPVFGKERQQQEEEKEGEGQEESRQVDVNRFFVFSSSSSVSEQEHESHKEEEEVGHASRRNKEIILSSSYDRGEMNCIESSSISLHLRREQYERGRREGEGRRTRRTRERRRRDSTVFTRAPCHSLHHHYHYKQRPLLLPHPLKYPSRQSSGWSDDDEEKKEEEEKELHVDTDEMMGDGEKKENRKEQSLQSHKISSSCPADTPSSLVLWCKVKHDEKASQTPTSCLSKEKNASFASSAPLPSSLSPSSRFKKKHSSHHKHASHPTSSSAGTTTERERSRSRGEKDTSMLREKERNEEEEGGLVSLDKSRGSIKTGKEEKEEEEGSSGCACSSSLNCRVEEGISPSKDERRTFRRKKISSSKHVCVSAVSYSSSPTSLSFFPRDEKIDRNNSYSREHEEEEKEHNGDDDDDGVAILSWCESLSVSSSENLSPLRLHHRPQLYCVCCGRKGFPEEEGEEEILASRQVKEEEKARENGPDDANLEEPFHRRRKRSPRNLECSSSATQEVDEGEKDRSFVARGGEEEQRQNEVKGTIPYEKKKKHQEQQQEEEESTDVKRKTSSTRFTCPSHQNHSSLNAPSSSIASFEGDREKRPLLLTSSQQDEIEETSCSKDVKTKDSHEAEIHPGHDERAENRKHRGGKAKEMLYRRFFSENDKDMRGCRGQGGAGSSSSSSSSCCSCLLPSRLCLSEDDRFFESSKGEREKFSSSCLEKENGQKDAVILCSPHESPSSHVENSSISALKREIGEGRTKSWEKDDRKDPRKSRDRVERRFCIGEAFSSGGKEREEMMKTKASRAGERLASSFHDERGTEEICWREQEEKEALSGEERERREEEKEELEGTTVVRNPDDEDDGRTEGIEDGEKTKEEERERERGTRKIESKDGCKFIEDPESFRWKREARRKVKDDGMRSSSADSLRGDLREKRKMPRVFSSSSSTTGRGYRHRRRFLSHSSTSPPDLLRGRRWREKERRDDMKREVSVPSFFHQRERIDLSLRERQENSPGLRRLLPVRESLEMCEDFLRQLDDEEKEDEFERTKLLSTLLGASPSGVRTPEEMAAYTPKEAVLSPSRLARTSSAGMNLEGHLHAGVLSEEKRMEEKEKDEERRGSIIDLSHESLSSFSPPLLIKTSSKYGFSPYQRNNSMGAHNLPRDGTLLSHNTRDLLQSDESHEASTRTFPGVYTHLDNNDNVDLHHLHRFSSAPSSSLPQTDKGEAFHSYNSSRHKVTSLMSSLDKSLDAISTERREDSERRKNSLSNPIQQISSSSLSSAVPPLSATAHPFSQLFLPRPSDMITHSMNEERERNFSSFIDQPFRDSKREVAKEVEEGDMRRSLPGQGEQAEREGHLFNPYLSMSNSNPSLLLPSSSCLHQTMFSHPSLLLPASSSFAHETVRPPSSLEIAAERSLPQLQANPPGDLSEAERIKDVSFPSEERECSLQRASSFSSSCYHAYASPSKGRDEEKEKEREREEKSLLQMNTKTDITGLRGKSDERVVCVAGLENEENAVKGLPLTPFAANHVKEEEGEKEKTNKKKDCRGLVSSTSICMYDVVSHEKEENGASLDLRKEKEGKEAEEEKEEENEWSRGDKHVNENLRELVLQRKTNELRIELQAIDEQQRRKQYIKEMRYTEETRRCQKSLRDLRGKYRRLIRDFVYNLNLLKERDATIEKVEKEVVLMIQEEKRKYQVLLKEKETKAVEVLSLYESRIQDLRNRCRSSVRTLQEKMKSDLQSLEMTMEKKCLERQEETERKVRKIEEKKQKILLAQAEQNARRNLHDMTRKLQTLQEKVEVQAKEIEEREKEVEGIKKKERQEVEKTISLGKELLELKKREEDAKSKVVELNNLHASLEAQISDLKQALTDQSKDHQQSLSQLREEHAKDLFARLEAERNSWAQILRDDNQASRSFLESRLEGVQREQQERLQREFEKERQAWIRDHEKAKETEVKELRQQLQESRERLRQLEAQLAMAVEGRFLAAEALQQLRLHGRQHLQHQPQPFLPPPLPQFGLFGREREETLNASSSQVEKSSSFYASPSGTLLKGFPSQRRSCSSLSSVGRHGEHIMKTARGPSEGRAGYYKNLQDTTATAPLMPFPLKSDESRYPYCQRSVSCHEGNALSSLSYDTSHNSKNQRSDDDVQKTSFLGDARHTAGELGLQEREEKERREKEEGKKTLLFPGDMGSLHLTPLELSPSSTDEGRGEEGTRLDPRITSPFFNFLLQHHHRNLSSRFGHLNQQSRVEFSTSCHQDTSLTEGGRRDRPPVEREGEQQHRAFFYRPLTTTSQIDRGNAYGMLTIRALVHMAKSLLSMELKDLGNNEKDLPSDVKVENDMLDDELEAFSSRPVPPETYRNESAKEGDDGEGDVRSTPRSMVVPEREIRWILEGLLRRAHHLTKTVRALKYRLKIAEDTQKSLQKERDTLMEITNRQCSKLHRLLDPGERQGNSQVAIKRIGFRADKRVLFNYQGYCSGGDSTSQGAIDSKLCYGGHAMSCRDPGKKTQEEEGRRLLCVSGEKEESPPESVTHNSGQSGRQAEREDAAVATDTMPLEVSGISAFSISQARAGRARGGKATGGEKKRTSEKR